MKSIVIGYGEIGKALYDVLNKAGYETYKKDVEPEEIIDGIQVMHICFPYSKSFVGIIKKYKKIYNPKYTIIHSTVPIGTAKKCDSYYSPVRGVHPHLENSLKTFVKYLAPRNNQLKRYFDCAGIFVKEHDSRETLEAMKLYCTTIYGLNIIAEKEMWNFCKKNKLDFETAYTDCNQTYNDGYSMLGYPQYKKYILQHKDGKIGGHCILSNCKMLGTDISKFILKQNKKL